MNLLRGQRVKLSNLFNHNLSFEIVVSILMRHAPGLCIDFSCFGLDCGGKLSDDRYMTFFNQPVTPCGAVRITRQNNNYAAFDIDLLKLPPYIDRLTVAAAIDGDGTMSQMIGGTVMLRHGNSNAATFTFTGGDFAAEKALMLVEIYRKEGDWRIYAVGQGFSGGLGALVEYFGGTVVGSSTDRRPEPNLGATTREYEITDEINPFWKPSGVSINVANVLIEGGLLYFGSGLTSIGSRSQAEPALIDPKLPIGRIASADYKQRVPYFWTSYSGAAPDTRAAYIKWLADGRHDPSAYIGYVLLYFYGLERRALADAKTSATAKSELPIIIQEVERLLKIYHGDALFRRWAIGLLDLLKLDCIESFSTKQYLDSPPDVISGVLPISLKLALGQLALDNEPIPAAWAYAWLMADPATRISMPARRCAIEFKKLFILKYQDSFGKGIRLPVNKSKIKVSYTTASTSFSTRTVERKLDIPDVTVLTSRIKKLQSIADQCAETLSAYSRLLGRNPDLAGTLDALLELPYSLWSEQQIKHIQTIKHTLETTQIPIAIEFTKLKAWLPEWQTITKSRVISFINRLAEAGLGIEPDPRFGGNIPENTTKVVLFIDDGKWTTPNPRYITAALTLHLAVVVSMADGAVGKPERDLLIRQVEDWLHLETVEKNRLHAHLRWLLSGRPELKSIKKRVETLPLSAREALADFVISVARADNNVTANEVRILEKIYKLLSLDSQSLYAKLHGFQEDEPVTIRPALPQSSGFAIPPPQEPKSGIQLDMQRIAALKDESKKVTDMLVALFEQEQAAETPAFEPKQADVAAENENLLGLDEAHSNIVKLLCSRNQWSRGELEEIAADCGIMLDGALEHINEAAYDIFDSPFTEGDDPVDINQGILEELFK